MPISITANLSGVNTGLNVLGRSLKDLQQANREMGAQLYSWVIRNYDSGGGLRDEPWAPLAPATVAQKLRLGYSAVPLAPRTGNLRQSFLPFSDANEAGVGARASYGVDYAQVHEEGAGNILARPMLPPEDVANEYAQRIYGEHVTFSIKKSGMG